MWRYVKHGVDVLTTLLMSVVAVAMIWRVMQPAPDRPGGNARPNVESVSGLSIAAAEVTHTRGEGRIALVEFADYECPYCAKHAQETGPSIKKKWLDAGDVRQVFFNFPLPIHPRAPKASEAAECAAKQGRFWEMHEQLFAEPTALDLPDLSARAKRIGLDEAAFQRCLDSGETAGRIGHDVQTARRLGVNSTPLFFLGTVKADGSIELVTRINGARPFDEFAAAVEKLRTTRQARR
jgi:protein-disulfide isomerase